MYRVAICDDERNFTEEASVMVASILNEDRIPYQIETYGNLKALLNALEIEKQCYNLIILDIVLKNKDGIELARQLTMEGKRISILFVSISSGILKEEYDPQPVHYLVKPIQREELRKAILIDYRTSFQKKYFHVKLHSGGVARISVKSIYYIEVLGKQLTIHTEYEPVKTVMTLGDAERALPPGVFVRCHRSFLVRLEAVQMLERYQITLLDGTKVPVGKQRYNATRRMVLEEGNWCGSCNE